MKQTNERLCALAQKGDATALDSLIDNNKSFIGKVANKKKNFYANRTLFSSLRSSASISRMASRISLKLQKPTDSI